ncbi:MAG: glycosyltransferase, partial [bacterium]
MRLSIVIPALDEAGVIADTLEALAPLVARGADIVVVDGGSRDATARIARERGARVLDSVRGRARQM